MPNKLQKASRPPREGASREMVSPVHLDQDRLSPYLESTKSSPRQLMASGCEECKNSRGHRDCDCDDKSCDSRGVVLQAPDKAPDRLDWEKAGEIPLLDADGTSRLFKSLYTGETAIGDQQMIIFVRHFFCGACQKYLKTLSSAITLKTYFTLPVPTSIVVIGLGSPSLIPEYRKRTGISFQIFTDPTRRLHKFLGLSWAVTMGPESKYYGMSELKWAVEMTKTFLSQKKNTPKEDRNKAGAWWWVGGEFLIRDGKLIWCHRMKTFRDHIDIETVKRLLNVDESDAKE